MSGPLSFQSILLTRSSDRRAGSSASCMTCGPPIGDHVDNGRLAGVEGPLQGRFQFFRLRDVFTMSPESLSQLVVPLLKPELDARLQNVVALSSRSPIPPFTFTNTHQRDVVPDRRVYIDGIDPEGAVTVDYQRLLVRLRQRRRLARTEARPPCTPTHRS